MVCLKVKGKLTYTNADAESGDDLLYEVECVGSDGCVGDARAVVKRDHVTLGQPCAQLTQNLLVPVLTEPNHLRNTRCL